MSWSGLPERLENKIIPEPNSGCWIWIPEGHPKGYGFAKYKAMGHRAHRLVYSLLVGKIPNGLVIDHKCRVRCCVNPEHLEPVTNLENIKRGITGQFNARKTQCSEGHPFDTENTGFSTHGKYTRRYCKKCNHDRIRQCRAEAKRK